MDVKIKDFTVEMPVKTNGIEFEIRENDETFLGDFYVTKTGVEWCNGKTTRVMERRLPGPLSSRT